MMLASISASKKNRVSGARSSRAKRSAALDAQEEMLNSQRYDAAGAKHYNYFRDYDPGIGRYVESDPIGLDGGINTYAYALNNPELLIDPTGLSIGLAHQIDLGVGFAVPIIGRVLGIGAGFGVTFRRCCENGNVYNEAFVSGRFGVSVGASAQPSSSGRGTIGLGRIGPMPKCLAESKSNFFNGLDFAYGPISVRVRQGTLQGGLSPGGAGASVTLNLAERQWSLGKQSTSLKCDCPNQ